jgi:hypothetical protein
MSNEELLGTIKLPYGNHNLRQITGNLPKANYGNGMRRNSSMPTCGLIKIVRSQNESIQIINELKVENTSRQNSRRGPLPPTIMTPNARYNEKLVMKKVAPVVGLPPIDQKHLNLRRGGE